VAQWAELAGAARLGLSAAQVQALDAASHEPGATPGIGGPPVFV